MSCSQIKTFKFVAGPRCPTSPVTAQLILQRWKIFSFWCYADCQQRSNERLVVLYQTRSSSFYGVKAFFRLGCMKLFKNVQSYGLAVLLETQPSPFHDVKKRFRLNVMQPVRKLQIHGWAALPNILCYGSAHLAALKNLFVLMLSRLYTTFKRTSGRVTPYMVQLT